MDTLNYERHGGKKDNPRLYSIWKGLRQRCQNPNSPSYSNYGGRGICVCSEWDSFSNFRLWALENSYSDDLSIDRINNDGNYEPGNCRWATDLVQARNSRHVHTVEAFGESKSISEWSEDPRCPVRYHTLKKRLSMGWPPEIAITKGAEQSRVGVARKSGQKIWQSSAEFEPKRQPLCQKGLHPVEPGSGQCRLCKNEASKLWKRRNRRGSESEPVHAG